jgi:hypothetical protein
MRGVLLGMQMDWRWDLLGSNYSEEERILGESSADRQKAKFTFARFN